MEQTIISKYPFSLFFSVLVAFVCCNIRATGQAKKHLQLQKVTISDVGLKDELPTYIAESNNTLSKTDKFKIPSLLNNFRIHNVGITYFITSDPCLLFLFKEIPKSVDVLIGTSRENEVLLIVDSNFNLDFSDDVVFRLHKNIPEVVEIKLTLFAEKRVTCSIPMEVVANFAGDEYAELSLKKLLIYKLQYILDKDTLNLNLEPNGIAGTSFKYPDYSFTLAKPLTQNRLYGLREPFYFAKRWWQIDNLNPVDATIELTQIENTDKMYGYYPGFFIPMEKLKMLTDNQILDKKNVDWSKKYFLLHFWGEWCQPCRAEMPKVKELNDKLVASGTTEMIHYPSVWDSTSLKRLNSYIKQNELKYPQSLINFQDVQKCSDKDKFEESCSVATLLRNLTYPRYILLDKEGRILYNGQLSQELFDKLRYLKSL